MYKKLTSIYSFLILMAVYGNSLAYDYPLSDPYRAAIIGTPFEFQADIPATVDVKTQSLKVFADRTSPDIFWFNDTLKYSIATQDGPAPLLFVIAGTGADYNAPKASTLLRIFYQAGFHVITISSPTHPSFIVSASLSSVPGNIQDDSKDLYHVMNLIWEDIRNDIEVTHFCLTGYSLGGSQAAFVSKLDEERKVFNFSKVLMINPPLNLFNSVSILDDMLVNNVPGGLDKMDEFMANTMDRFSEFYTMGSFVDIDDEFLFEAFKTIPASSEQLAAVIGISFRISAANMYFTSDVVKNSGYIVPKNLPLTVTSSLTDFMIVSFRVSFVEYFNEYFYPFFQAKQPNLTRQDLIDSSSLKSIEKYLASSNKIGLMTNQDDFIMAPGEIEYLQSVFKARAKVFPIGSHLGNLAHRDNVAFMLDFFKQ